MSEDARIDASELVRRTNILYFQSRAYEHTYWMGIRTAKCPMDMWAYQEIMFSSKTDLVIETGTLLGGSALFFAHMLDILGRGRVVSIDINHEEKLPQHPRIEYIVGSSTSSGVLDQVNEISKTAESVMVVLDSDHKAPYKYEELNAYQHLVTEGSYLIAEDSAFDFYPAWPEFGPGPATAVKKFMEHNDSYEIVRDWEKHMLTFSPAAFLRKKPTS